MMSSKEKEVTIVTDSEGQEPDATGTGTVTVTRTETDDVTERTSGASTPSLPEVEAVQYDNIRGTDTATTSAAASTVTLSSTISIPSTVSQRSTSASKSAPVLPETQTTSATIPSRSATTSTGGKTLKPAAASKTLSDQRETSKATRATKHATGTKQVPRGKKLAAIKERERTNPLPEDPNTPFVWEVTGGVGRWVDKYDKPYPAKTPIFEHCPELCPGPWERRYERKHGNVRSLTSGGPYVGYEYNYLRLKYSHNWDKKGRKPPPAAMGGGKPPYQQDFITDKAGKEKALENANGECMDDLNKMKMALEFIGFKEKGDKTFNDTLANLARTGGKEENMKRFRRYHGTKKLENCYKITTD